MATVSTGGLVLPRTRPGVFLLCSASFFELLQDRLSTLARGRMLPALALNRVCIPAILPDGVMIVEAIEDLR